MNQCSPSNLSNILIILAVASALILAYTYLVAPEHSQIEGFTQSQPYVFKGGNDVYDDFYVEAYDNLFCNDLRSENEIFHLIDTTGASVNRSNILDLGAGTGYLVEKLNQRGYKAYGIDKNAAMQKHNNENHENAIIKHGDFLDPMAFDKGIFSHILCTNFTLYEVKNKTHLFINAHSWLKHNGYFMVHVIDADKFDTTVPLAKPTLLMNPQKHSNQKLSKTHINFNGFKYDAEYIINTATMYLKERFQDNVNKNVRENEHIYYLETPENIEKLAKSVGFHLHSKAKMTNINGDKHQYLYIFEKSH
mgnify:CR=1 FL=1